MNESRTLINSHQSEGPGAAEGSHYSTIPDFKAYLTSPSVIVIKILQNPFYFSCFLDAELINCVKTENLNRVSVKRGSLSASLLCCHQTLTSVFQLMELHQQAADILLQDAAGCTLLHHAVEAGSKEILKYLIDNGESQRFQ